MASKPESILLNDGFWDSAFIADDPFREELQREFRRGLIEGTTEDLNWARLGMYSITDSALWPIVTRLIEWAIEHPRADFVESLVFYLSRKSELHRLSRLQHDRDYSLRVGGLTASLRSQLEKCGSNDLSMQLGLFKEMLSAAE